MGAGQSPLRLAFAGTPRFAVPSLEALHAAGHRILAVYTQADRPAGRGRALQPSAVKLRALALGLRVEQPTGFRDEETIEGLRRLEVDAFVVVAYGLILPAAALAIPRLGCLNVHASLLPRWRGAAPIQRAILAGDRLTGVSIMRMEAGLDTGPVYARAERPIGFDDAGTLGEALANLGAASLCATLGEISAGRAVAVPQSAEGVTYAAKVDKTEAAIDWSADAASIERQVRAFNPWPVAETRWRGEQLRIWGAAIAPDGEAARPEDPAPGRILAADSRGVEVACGRGRLRLLRVQRPGRRIVDAVHLGRADSLVGERLGPP